MEKVLKTLSVSCKIDLVFIIFMSIVIGILLWHVIELQGTVNALERICEASVNY